MRFSRFLFYPVVFGFFILSTLACHKTDKIDSTAGLKLSFSVDTVFFDTVFPTIGSVTRRLIVHNPNKNKVSVASIRLAGGGNSSYRINVNGNPTLTASDIEIAGGDSLFIFVKVTIDPNKSDIPFVVSDSIEFTTNGTYQNVKLVAWGRNAIFYRNATLKGNIVWDSLRAHVIYGFLRIDTNATLTILPGTRVYFHKDAWLSISFHSTLKVHGVLGQPVRFQGDRLDPFYKDLPGQWGGIYLDQGSRDHEITYAVIKNGTFGLSADSLGSQGAPLLLLNDCIIRNMTSIGIFAYGSNIRSENCVIGDCGGYAVYVEYGGTYDFRQLTVANYWYASVRHVPSIGLTNFTQDTLGNKKPNALTNAYFGNVILFGAEDEEIMLDSVATAPFNFTFDHALLKTLHPAGNASGYVHCIVNKDPGFVDVSKYDYRIDSISPAIHKGSAAISISIPYDINGVTRGQDPDLGAYEYVKKN